MEKIRDGESQKEKMQVRPKVGKLQNTVFFPMFCGSESSLAKAAGVESSGHMRHEKVHAVVARSTCPSQHVQNTSASNPFWKLRCRKSARPCAEAQFQVNMHETPYVRTTFGRPDVEKAHTVLAQSTKLTQYLTH